jgi:ABC-type multidrug transport system fused ATPase/permease subunit
LKKPVVERSITRALAKAFGRTVALAGIVKLVQDIFLFLGPFWLQKILQFVQASTNSSVGEEPPLEIGLMYVVLLLTTSLCQVTSLQIYQHILYKVGFKVKMALMSVIYRKALRISFDARQETSTGTLMNLLSTDAGTPTGVIYFLNLLWSSPSQIIVALILLWRLLGPAVLAGVSFMLITLPLNAWLFRRMSKIEEEFSAKRDERVKRVNEMLLGIRVVKAFAWEESFEKTITDAREQELGILKTSLWLRAIDSTSWAGVYLFCVCAWCVFVMLEESVEKTITELGF